MSDDHLGANYIFSVNDLSQDGFAELVEKLGVKALRYPGGSVTELQFDVTDPDRTETESGERLTPLSAFLDFCKAHGITPNIVLPTAPVLTEARDGSGHRMVDMDAVAETRAFVEALVDNPQGLKIGTIEIGNEYWGAAGMTAVEYGRVASALAPEVDAALNAGGSADTAVAVQVGLPWGTSGTSSRRESNDVILREFTATELAAVDGVIDHLYFDRELYDTNLYDGVAQGYFGDGYVFNELDYWSQRAGRPLDYMITEWSPINASTQDPRGEKGLKQGILMLEKFQSMLEHGVDEAAIWPLIHNTQNSLSFNRNSTEASIIGDAFRFITDDLVGKISLDFTPGDGNIGEELRFNSDQGHVMRGFAGADGQVTIFVSSLREFDQNFTFDFNDVLIDVKHVWARKLGAYAPGDATPWDNSKARGDIETFHQGELVDGAGNINFSLGAHEMIRLDFSVRDVGLQLEGGDLDLAIGANQNDVLIGGKFADEILGHIGDDWLDGAGGGDILRGGAGTDTLIGGFGSDVLDVGAGGAGRQIAIGGAGPDTFIFAEGYGEVLVIEDANPAFGGRHDKLLMEGISFEDVVFSVSQVDLGVPGIVGALRIDLLGTDDSITLATGFTAVETIVFEGGWKVMPLTDGLGVGGVVLRLSVGSDVVSGTDGVEHLYGLRGHDVISAEGGLDVVYAGAGRDTVFGGDGGDVLLGEVGRDVIHGGDGGDILLGGGGGDQLFGDAGNDDLRGDRGRDTLDGGEGDDVLFGDIGFDRLIGGVGDDTLFGQGGRDVLLGGDGADVLHGDVGLDTLDGGAGGDVLYGGRGEDQLEGGDGDDYLSGGARADSFVFSNGSGADFLVDFTVGVDKIALRDVDDADFVAIALADLATDDVGGVLIDFGVFYEDEASVFLHGVTAAQLSFGDFLLI